MSKKNARQLADDLAGYGQEIDRLARAEVREDMADEMKRRYLGEPGLTSAANTAILAELADNPVMQTPELQAARERFEEDGVARDFRAGILFAVKLFADPTFDY